LVHLGLVHQVLNMVGITIWIVIRLQESVVACVLQPWSGGKDPDRYTFACLVGGLSDTGVPVLPTTPVSRSAHMGCSSKL
jgi:hypothetical protein